MAMVPGEYRLLNEPVELLAERRRVRLDVTNVGDRPVQVGSHYVFSEVNPALEHDRSASRGMRLDIPSGTAVRFEPGERRPVSLVEIGGAQRVMGHRSGADVDAAEAQS